MDDGCTPPTRSIPFRSDSPVATHMMPRKEFPWPTATDWSTEHLRLTVFAEAERPFGQAREMWQSLVGEPPTEVTENPQTDTIQLQRQDGTSVLHMLADNVRMDLRQLYRPLDAKQTDGPPFLNAQEQFARLVKSWLQKKPLNDVQRIAFGSTVLRCCATLSGCHDVLQAFVPIQEVPAYALEDFLYQTNRWRQSKLVTGLRINRLVKWSVQRVNRMQIDAAAGVGSTSSLVYYARLGLDVNSAPEHASLLLPHRLETLFGELVKLAIRFHSSGE